MGIGNSMKVQNIRTLIWRWNRVIWMIQEIIFSDSKAIEEEAKLPEYGVA